MATPPPYESPTRTTAQVKFLHQIRRDGRRSWKCAGVTTPQGTARALSATVIESHHEGREIRNERPRRDALL